MPPAPAPDAAAGLAFEFWNDHAWQAYPPTEQRLLQAAMRPRQPLVALPCGRYHVKDFDKVEHGFAVQLNLATGFRRCVRIRPPYVLDGHPRASCLPGAGYHFEFLNKDGSWQPFGGELQRELSKVAESAPPPKRVFYFERGHPYYLFGLEELVNGRSDCLVQINMRTDVQRKVALREGPPPATGRLSTSSAASSSAGIVRSGHGARPSDAFALRKVVVEARGPIGPAQPVSGDARTAVLEQWRAQPRPDRVRLPDCWHVLEGFAGFEAGKAFVRTGSAEMLLMVPRCDPPQEGSLHLPEMLDDRSRVTLGSCGKFLSESEVAALTHAAPGVDMECAICKVDMEPEPNPIVAQGETPIVQLACGHRYHTTCLTAWFATRQNCPQCLREYGKVVGRGPRVGTMSWCVEPFAVSGHPDASQTIKVTFAFPCGADDDGNAYESRKSSGYLPCNFQGVVLLELFKVAFRRRVMFGIGHSMTTGRMQPTYNIHLKTRRDGGQARHGYPDDTYFQRSLKELQSSGVTIADLPE